MQNILDAKHLVEARLARIDQFSLMQLDRFNFWEELKAQHEVVSIMFSQGNWFYTRPQRVTIVLAGFLTTAAIDAFIYNGEDASLPSFMDNKNSTSSIGLAVPEFKAPGFLEAKFWANIYFEMVRWCL